MALNVNLASRARAAAARTMPNFAASAADRAELAPVIARLSATRAEIARLERAVDWEGPGQQHIGQQDALIEDIEAQIMTARASVADAYAAAAIDCAPAQSATDTLAGLRRRLEAAKEEADLLRQAKRTLEDRLPQLHADVSMLEIRAQALAEAIVAADLSAQVPDLVSAFGQAREQFARINGLIEWCISHRLLDRLTAPKPSTGLPPSFYTADLGNLIKALQGDPTLPVPDVITPG